MDIDCILAGIVTYNPDISQLKENINFIINQVTALIVVDNGSKNIEEIARLISNDENRAKIIRNNKNLGIARALNIMMSYARENGFEWVLSLDQDSCSPLNLISEYKKYIRLERIAIICPNYADRNVERKLNTVGISYINKCITSGALVKVRAWNECGYYDEKMFIDGVDFEFCDRLTRHGYKIIRINNIVLMHEIGNSCIRHFLFWNVLVKNHSAFRKYYIARNTIYAAKKQYRLLLKPILQNIKLLLIAIVYEKDKRSKIKAILKGTYDGIRITQAGE